MEDKYSEFIKNFMERYQYKKEVEEEIHVDNRLIEITDLCILLQEFSRRSLNWPIIKLGKLIPDGNSFLFDNNFTRLTINNISLPEEVISLLYINQDSLILAGGSCVDMLLNRNIRDYDLFCIKERPKHKFGDNKLLETMHSISTITSPKIQIIKRIYDSPQQVIGGFDLESSRFYMNSNLEVFSTIGGLMALTFQINPINFACYSSSFGRRIMKYRKKGFSPVFVNSKQPILYHYSSFNSSYPGFIKNNTHTVHFSDYGIQLSREIFMSFKEKVFRINFTCMMKGEVEGFCVYKNKIHKIEEFLTYARTLYKSDRNNQYLGQVHYFPKTEFGKSFAKLNLNTYHLNHNKIAKLIYCLRVQNIHKYYPQYGSFTDKFRISNPGTQMTSSFHPIEFKTLNEYRLFKKQFFGTNYVPHDSSSSDIISWLIICRRWRYPKPVCYMICCYITSFKLLQIFDKKQKEDFPQESETKSNKKTLDDIGVSEESVSEEEKKDGRNSPDLKLFSSDSESDEKKNDDHHHHHHHHHDDSDSSDSSSDNNNNDDDDSDSDSDNIITQHQYLRFLLHNHLMHHLHHHHHDDSSSDD